MAEKADKTGHFRWTAKRDKAALLLAEDALTDAEIAERVGVARSTLSEWKTRPEFMARVEEQIEALNARAKRYRIAKRAERVGVLDQLHTGLLGVVAERAEQMGGEGDGEAIAGGGTGLLVRQEKMIGTGENATVIVEYHVDTGLIHEIRSLQKQAAQELGQWNEKSTVEHSGGIRREYVLVTGHDTMPLTEAELDALDAE